MHDLGHCPFSHLLDNVILKEEKSIYKEHENRSCLILNHIVKKNNININDEELSFIYSIINPTNYKKGMIKYFMKLYLIQEMV